MKNKRLIPVWCCASNLGQPVCKSKQIVRFSNLAFNDKYLIQCAAHRIKRVDNEWILTDPTTEGPSNAL
jgi:hypothetical protein